MAMWVICTPQDEISERALPGELQVWHARVLLLASGVRNLTGNSKIMVYTMTTTIMADRL